MMDGRGSVLSIVMFKPRFSKQAGQSPSAVSAASPAPHSGHLCVVVMVLFSLSPCTEANRPKGYAVVVKLQSPNNQSLKTEQKPEDFGKLVGVASCDEIST